MAFKEIPIAAAAELVKLGQFEYTDGGIRYLGNSGSIAKNAFGSWTAPGLPETADAPNVRPVEISTEKAAIDIMDATNDLAGVSSSANQPAMVAPQDRGKLTELGYSSEQIDAMSPQEAIETVANDSPKVGATVSTPTMDATASVPVMITNAQQKRLLDEGFSQEEINAMTPEQAQGHLADIDDEVSTD